MNIFDAVPYRKNATTNIGEPVEFPRPVPQRVRRQPRRSASNPTCASPIEALRLMREAGLQFLNISAGCPYYNPHFLRPADTPPPDGYEMPESGLIGVDRHFRLAAEIQRTFPDMAMVGTGYSYLRHFAAEPARRTCAPAGISYVGIGRGAIAYPDWVKDLQAKGSLEKLKACITVELLHHAHAEQDQRARPVRRGLRARATRSTASSSRRSARRSGQKT
jgi:2,4-dienoyl-CoA reductase-like NADH-dependent reductase (Old Yellow Enzyme family)